MFKWIIFDNFDGSIKGTNDDKIAAKYAILEEYFIYNTQSGKWLNIDCDEIDIEEIK